VQPRHWSAGGLIFFDLKLYKWYHLSQFQKTSLERSEQGSYERILNYFPTIVVKLLGSWIFWTDKLAQNLWFNYVGWGWHGDQPLTSNQRPKCFWNLFTIPLHLPIIVPQTLPSSKISYDSIDGIRDYSCNSFCFNRFTLLFMLLQKGGGKIGSEGSRSNFGSSDTSQWIMCHLPHEDKGERYDLWVALLQETRFSWRVS